MELRSAPASARPTRPPAPCWPASASSPDAPAAARSPSSAAAPAPPADHSRAAARSCASCGAPAAPVRSIRSVSTWFAPAAPPPGRPARPAQQRQPPGRHRRSPPPRLAPHHPVRRPHRGPSQLQKHNTCFIRRPPDDPPADNRRAKQRKGERSPLSFWRLKGDNRGMVSQNSSVLPWQGDHDETHPASSPHRRKGRGAAAGLDLDDRRLDRATVRRAWCLRVEARDVATIRETVLAKLISGELQIPNVHAAWEVANEDLEHPR